MRELLSIIFLVILSCYSLTEATPVVVQLKYAPWGTIDADEEDFNNFFYYDESEFQKYDMNFERSVGARIIANPYYISINRSITDLDVNVPDAKVDTISAGLGGIALDINAYNTYLIGSFGVGRGKFQFKQPEKNDWEYFFDANAEIGFHFEEHLLIGFGVDCQVFGSPGETKANYWNLYLGTGISF